MTQLRLKPITTALRILAAAILMLLPNAAFSAYVTNMPLTLTQPDGTVINCLVSGDEFYNWAHDSNGFVIVQRPDTGYYTYGVLVDGQVVPSEHIVGTVDPAKAGLTPNIKPSLQRLQAARHSLFALPAGTSPQPAPTTGTLNNITVFIRFSDDSEMTSPVSAYDTIFNSTAPDTSSMMNYFLEASYNALTVSTTFYPTPSGTTVASYQDSHPRGYYMPYNAVTNTIGYKDDGGSREQQMLANAINSIKSMVPSSLDIDKDKDGNVDNICFIIKGTTTDWGTVLWPHQWVLFMQDARINNKRVTGYNVQFTEWILAGGVGVLSHEMLHSLGCPDLYHYSGASPDPIGPWDVMCGTGEPPQHPGAYMKYKYLHWLPAPTVISAAGTYTLNPVTSPTDNCYKIVSPNSTSEFFIVEYRRKAGTFEQTIPGSGMLVYRINTKYEGNADGPPDEIYVYRPGGTPTSDGVLNKAAFSAESGRTQIDDTTDPASFLTNGDAGGLTITGIGSAGDTISFMLSSQLPTPVISPNGGTFATPQTVTLTCPSGISEIHYTLDGSDPDENAPFVASGGTVLVETTATLKARSYNVDFTPSEIASADFKIITMTIDELKANPDGTEVGISGMAVTAAFPGEFYVESDQRIVGILVKKTGHTLAAGMRANVVGIIKTDTTGERYIAATLAEAEGSGTILPFAANTAAIGGGDFKYDSTTGAGQRGVWAWRWLRHEDGTSEKLWEKATGLNNIGLLVRTAGRVNYIDKSTFTIDDGSANPLTCVAPAGMIVDRNWDHISITGVSSCFKSGTDVKSRLRVADTPNMMINTGAMITGMITADKSGVTNKLIDSVHPYASNTDYTWTVTAPYGTARMRVHFAKLQIETTYDKLYVLDGAGAPAQIFSSSVMSNDVWSNWVNGNVLKLRLKSDTSVQYYGFQMDKFEIDAPAAALPGVTVTLEPGALSATTDDYGVFFFRGLGTGTYTFTPFQTGSTFTPVDRSATVTFGDYAPNNGFAKN